MAADIDMKQGYGSSIFELARCYRKGIGTEKSLENAIHFYKFAAENGFPSGYYEVAQCYRKLGGGENEEKADTYFKMAEAGMKIDNEQESKQKIVEMKKQHKFKLKSRMSNKLFIFLSNFTFFSR